MRARQNHVCRENYVKARSYSFRPEAAAIHKSSSNIQFRENWYALYISIIKSMSINSALDFMDMKPQYTIQEGSETSASQSTFVE